MLYQRKNLITGDNMGNPDFLPHDLVGLTDASLADLSAAVPEAAAELGYEGQGFFPYSPPPPPPLPPEPVILNKVDFLRLFLQTERISIRAASAVNTVIADYQYMLDAATTVNLQDPDILTGIPLLEQVGLIGPGRATQILANEPPA